MSEAHYPDELLYHPAHDWARVEGDTAEFGITWYAQDQLGDVVFFQPPEPGTHVVAGQSYGEIESVKAVNDIIAPLDGDVVEVNTELVDQPELVNADPYRAWMVRVTLTDPGQTDILMSADDYEKSLRKRPE